MKYLLFILALFITCSVIYSQDNDDRFPKQREKIKQLAKLKLIETLNLTEEESIRFFARFNELHKNIDNLQKRKNETIDEMRSLIDEGEKNFDETKYNEILKRITDFGSEEIKVRNNFINSVQEILPKYKVAKLIVFEREFNKQLRNLMEEKGEKRWNK